MHQGRGHLLKASLTHGTQLARDTPPAVLELGRRKSLQSEAQDAASSAVTTSESALFKARFLIEKQSAALNLLDHLPREQVTDELLAKIIEFDEEKRAMAESELLKAHVRVELQGRLTSVWEYVEASSAERASKRKAVEKGSAARGQRQQSSREVDRTRSTRSTRSTRDERLERNLSEEREKIAEKKTRLHSGYDPNASRMQRLTGGEALRS